MGTLHTGLDGFNQIAMGWSPECSNVVKFGRNPDVDAASSPEDVWPGGGLYTGFPAGVYSSIAETVTVVSASANDAAAGTGMRTLRMLGLGAAGTAQTEDITMNGTNAVTSANTWYRIFRVFGLTAGSGATNAGAVTIRHSSTTANIFCVMTAGTAQSHIAAYTIPINKIGLFTRAHVSVSNAQQSAQEITGSVVVRAYGSGIWRHVNTNHVTTSSSVEIRSDGGTQIPALTDLAIRVMSATADNLDVTAAFDLFLFPA